MQVLPPALKNLIDAFGSLPGVGPRTAERYAYYFAKQPKSKALELADKLTSVTDGISTCKITFALIPAGETVSALYSDPSRDKQTITVVEDPFDIKAIEDIGFYKGTYHVLGGLVSPIDDIGPEKLTIKQLVERIKKDKAKEVILATNASVEGESTALYIKKQLEDTQVKVTRLAQGLPIGVDLEYADKVTLGRALENRQDI